MTSAAADRASNKVRLRLCVFPNTMAALAPRKAVNAIHSMRRSWRLLNVKSPGMVIHVLSGKVIHRCSGMVIHACSG